MTITRLPATTCPACHATLDAHGDELDPGVTAPRPPAPGDCTVCFYCTAILMFDDRRVPRLLTAAERAALAPDDEVFEVQRTIRRFKAAQN